MTNVLMQQLGCINDYDAGERVAICEGAVAEIARLRNDTQELTCGDPKLVSSVTKDRVLDETLRILIGCLEDGSAVTPLRREMTLKALIELQERRAAEPPANARDWMCRACTAGPFTHEELDLHWAATHALKSSVKRWCPSTLHQLGPNETCDCVANP